MRFKLFLLILIFILPFAFFTGCNKKAPDETGGGETPGAPLPSGASSASTPIRETGGGRAQALRIFLKDRENTAESDALADLIARKFELDIQIIPCPEEAENYTEALNILIASGGAPDIFHAPPEPSLLREWIGSGVIREIPARNYPKLENIFDADLNLRAYRTLYGGGCWYAPVTRGAGYYQQGAYAEMIVLDLDCWLEEDGRYVPAYYSDKTLEILNYARGLRESGLPVFTGEGEAYPGAYVIITGRDFDRHEEGLFFSAALSDGMIDSVLKLLDYSLTEEARDYGSYGLAGVNYTRNANGLFLFTDPETNRAYDINACYPVGAFLLGLIAGADEIPNGEPARHSRPFISENGVLCRALPSPARDALNVNIDITAIVTGEGDVSGAFESFREECRKQGVEEALREVNEALNVLVR